MILNKTYSALLKVISVFLILTHVASCAYLNLSSARSLHYLYQEKRNNAGYALQEPNCEKAESEMLEAVKIAKVIQEKLPDTKAAGSDLAEAYKLLGHIYTDDNCKKKYPEALDVYNKSKELRELIYGANDPLYAHILNDIAWNYHFQQKEYDKAETLLLRAKTIYETNPSTRGSYLPMVYTNLGEVYRAQGRIQEAEKFEKKANEN